MKVRSIDSLHDWQFGKGFNDYRSNGPAIIQNINTRLNSFLGNCFFDQSAGINWFGFIGGKDLTGLQLAISATILNTENVLSLVQLNLLLNAERQFVVSYSVSTTFGVYSAQTTISAPVA